MTYIPETLRNLVSKRARMRCEYCYLHQDYTFYTHEIDHIYAEKHGGTTVDDNLCLACADCNRHKGSNLCSLDLETGEITALFHPRRDIWQEHFNLDNRGAIRPLTAKGRVTEKVLGYNRLDLIADRLRLMNLGAYSEFTDQ